MDRHANPMVFSDGDFERPSFERTTLNDEERDEISENGDIVEHRSEMVVVDPETKERWALCWLRVGTQAGEESHETP